MPEHLAENIIDIEDFKEFDANNKAEIESIKENIKLIEKRLADENKEMEAYNIWLRNILQYKDISEITREILANLIDSIYISEKDDVKEIEINFKFKNPLQFCCWEIINLLNEVI